MLSSTLSLKSLSAIKGDMRMRRTINLRRFLIFFLLAFLLTSFIGSTLALAFPTDDENKMHGGPPESILVLK